MPVNRAYPVDRLLEAAGEYAEKTGRRVTFEYTLIKGENDMPRDMELMKKKLRGMLCHVNLIPLNRVEELSLIHIYVYIIMSRGGAVGSSSGS